PFPSENNSGRGFMAKQIGYAVVGAGPFVERALLPAFARAGGETRLAAIVSADRTRAHALAREHRATGYHYDEFRQALQRDDVRLQRRLGGGTVYDLGVPAIFVARTVFDAEPAQVMAMTARMTRRYGGDVDESTVALIRLPDDRLAHLHTSFGEEPTSVLTVFGDQGSIRR